MHEASVVYKSATPKAVNETLFDAVNYRQLEVEIQTQSLAKIVVEFLPATKNFKYHVFYIVFVHIAIIKTFTNFGILNFSSLLKLFIIFEIGLVFF